MKIIDGKKISSLLLDELAKKISLFPREIGLAFIIVGDNPASVAYVRMKKKACEKLKIHSIVDELPSNVSADELLRRIESVNQNHRLMAFSSSCHFHPIWIQFKLPERSIRRRTSTAFTPSMSASCF